MEEADIATCKHKKWVPAGYLYALPDGRKVIQVRSIYEVWCFECQHFIHLMSPEKHIDNQGLHSTHQLVPMKSMGFYWASEEDKGGTMNGDAKTGLEREINRKLDALKDALENLAEYLNGPSIVSLILREAWKEEEEVRREQGR